MFSRIKLKSRIVWDVLRGRNFALHAAIVEGRPVASGVKAQGIDLGPHGLAVNCIATNDMRNGFVIGNGAVVIGCVATGCEGYGFTYAQTAVMTECHGGGNTAGNQRST